MTSANRTQKLFVIAVWVEYLVWIACDIMGALLVKHHWSSGLVRAILALQIPLIVVAVASFVVLSRQLLSMDVDWNSPPDPNVLRRLVIRTIEAQVGSLSASLMLWMFAISASR